MGKSAMTLTAIAGQLYRQLDLNMRYEARDKKTILKALKKAQEIKVLKSDKRSWDEVPHYPIRKKRKK